MELEVVQVMNKCAANYRVGDRVIIDDAILDLKNSTNVCLYALSSLMPYLTPLSRELSESDWMNKVTELRCGDGGVKFKVTRIKK